MLEKVCLECGKKYFTRLSKQSFCSTSCRSKNIRKNAKEFDMTCVVCGKKYKSKASNSIYCSNRCNLDAIRVLPKAAKCSWCGKEYMKFKGKMYCSSLCKRLSKQDLRKQNLKNNPDARLSFYLRHFLYRAIKGKQYNSRYYLGFTVQELKSHLESQFKNGMSWDNYGEWHIDHIRPLVSFNFYKENGEENIEEIKKAMALSNLQPLWARDNISKGGRYKPLED